MAIVFPFEIIHKTKGEGTAISLVKKGDDTYVKIDFKTTQEEFVFPDQFVCLLKAKDPVLQSEIVAKYDEGKNGHEFHLVSGYPAGKKAIDIYDKCCEDFGWDSSFRGQFGAQKRLFAENATPEGYSVWMIVHNSLFEPYNEKHSWYDFIKGETIEEVWLGELGEFFQDASTRVTFVRTAYGYKFWGIYKLDTVAKRAFKSKMRAVKVYKRVDKIYPVENLDPQPPLESATCVTDQCRIEVSTLETNEKKTMDIDVKKRPFQNKLIGLAIGDIFTLPMGKGTYQIEKII